MAATVTLAGRVAVEGAAAAPHALARLREEAPAVDWRPADPGAAAGTARLVLARVPGMAEGAFATEATAGDPPEVRVAASGLPGLIWGVEALLAEGAGPRGLTLPAGRREEAPGLAYRTFWTWDHSTNWELSQIGQQEIGVFNPYGKPPGGFLADYRRLVDWCSRHRVAAVVVYGFLRDSHGGAEAAGELARYAAARGVRVLPGIAIGSYGGVWWEGDHPYNLATWLRKHPENAATLEKGVGFQIADLAFPLNFPRSDYTLSACPSRPATMAWMEEAVDWLARSFEIGGINIEAGDYGVCGCDLCVARRANAAEAARRVDSFGDSWSHTDMADNFPRLFRAAKAANPDLWVYSEIQWDNLLDPVAQSAQARLPAGGIYQHTTNRSYWGRLKRELTRDYVAGLPMQPNVLRCQFACQWNGDARTERFRLNAADFAAMARLCAATGLAGLTVWGEPSPYSASVELSYLAFARFTWDPSLSWERFMAEEAAPRLGGVEAAARFVVIAGEIDANAALPLDRLALLGAEAGGMAAEGGEAGRRWLTLADTIARRRYMGR
ncbi:MAG: hypothetical protein KJZ85_03440 [Rhodobacteraceae bacterium]|jgi:hypothetical protein|nr:hypothetical protein [Paracoccaceae bacterium]